MTSEQARLGEYIAAWKSAVDDTIALLRDLTDDDWSSPTDLPGWDVRAVAAHLAHLESELAGNAQTAVEVPELDHVRSPMSAYTEMGPIARVDWPTERIVDELEAAVAKRLGELEADPPGDPAGHPPITPANIGWNWATLLSNRPLDVWMHEQDIRRAVGRPGGMDTPGARHSVAVFVRGFGYVVGKLVAPPAGTTVLLDVTGENPVHLAVIVDADGRGVPLDQAPSEPTVALTMDLETFVVLSGGRRAPSEVTVQLTGDQATAALVLAAMAVTP